MTGGVLRGLLKRYGQTVCLHSGGGQEVQTRAFLQPVLDRREDRWQSLPTPLGEARRDRFLYLGPPDAPLEGLEENWLQWNGRKYEIMQAQPIYVGRRLSHWWGLLRPRDAEE